MAGAFESWGETRKGAGEEEAHCLCAQRYLSVVTCTLVVTIFSHTTSHVWGQRHWDAYEAFYQYVCA